MADLNDVKDDLGEEMSPIPSLDGAAESATKSKANKKQVHQKQAKGNKCTLCQGKTVSATGICAKCKKDGKKAPVTKATAGNAAAEVDSANNRAASTPVTPEPLTNNSDYLDAWTGSSRILGRQSTYELQSSPEVLQSSDSGFGSQSPSNVKDEEPTTYASPMPIVRSNVAVEPIVEVLVSSSNKRSLSDVERKDDGERNHDIDAVPRKQRKLNSTTSSSNDSDTQDSAIQAFQNAITTQEDAQAQQIANLQQAQEDQLKALKSAQHVQLSTLTAASASFVTGFNALQGWRDYYEGEMFDWKGKHASLEAILEHTGEERDNWKAAKEQVDREKDDVTKERDDWMSAKQRVDKEKAAVEQAKEESDEANAAQIAGLKEQVEKLRKGKADLIKQLTAGDSD